MSAKALLFHAEARSKMCAGLDILANAVKVTLGPKGRTVVLERPFGPPTIINSGVMVAREIELPDKFENIGAQMAREVSSRTAEKAGDGTTTATVLAQAIVQLGMKFVASGFDPMDLKRGIDAAVDAIEMHLQQNSAKINSSQEIEQVGAISANGDSAIGAMIAQAMERVGRNGVIKVEDGRSMHNALEVVEGLQFERAAAVEEGIGAGGGVALLRARCALDGLKLPNPAQEAGIHIVRQALEEPLRQIIINAGGEPAVIIEAVSSGTGRYGYNAASGEYGDMMAMGIIDPTKVTRLALKNAASIASLFLTTDCVVVELPSPAGPAGMLPDMTL